MVFLEVGGVEKNLLSNQGHIISHLITENIGSDQTAYPSMTIVWLTIQLFVSKVFAVFLLLPLKDKITFCSSFKSEDNSICGN